jgi:hypothetical protein
VNLVDKTPHQAHPVPLTLGFGFETCAIITDRHRRHIDIFGDAAYGYLEVDPVGWTGIGRT